MFYLHFSRNYPQHIASSNVHMYTATLGHAMHIGFNLHLPSYTVWLEKPTSIGTIYPSSYLTSYERVLNVTSEAWQGVILVD